jgi:hypothetical protein
MATKKGKLKKEDLYGKLDSVLDAVLLPIAKKKQKTDIMMEASSLKPQASSQESLETILICSAESAVSMLHQAI